MQGKNLLGSASKLHRTLKCPASHLLPATRERSPRADKAADRGKALHYYCEIVPELGPDQALLQVPRNYHRYTRQIEHHKLAGRCTSKRLREVAMVHDAETGKCRLLSTSDRDYGVLKPTETPGTADVVIAGFRTAEVWDYKTGRWPVPASGNPQLEHLALMAVRTVAPEATQVVVGIQTLASYGKVVTESAVVDTLSLDEHEAKVREAQERATRVQAQIEAGEEPDVYPGDHCMFCPAQPGCPAHKEK